MVNSANTQQNRIEKDYNTNPDIYPYDFVMFFLSYLFIFGGFKR